MAHCFETRADQGQVGERVHHRSACEQINACQWRGLVSFNTAEGHSELEVKPFVKIWMKARNLSDWGMFRLAGTRSENRAELPIGWRAASLPWSANKRQSQSSNSPDLARVHGGRRQQVERWQASQSHKSMSTMSKSEENVS